MIKTVYTNGCSWTFGSELEQDRLFRNFLNNQQWKMQDPADELNWNIVDKNNEIVSRFDHHYDKFNWSGQISKLVGATELVNHALGGGSNNRILRTTLDYVRSLSPNDYKTTLIVIGWTAAERNEIYVNKEWQRWNINQPFNQTVDKLHVTDEDYINRIDKLHQDYIGLIHDDYVNIKTYFDTVYLLSNTLTNLGIKHYFFNALPAWWEGGEYKTDCNVEQCFAQELHWHENHKNIQNFSDSFMHFVHRNNYVVAKYLHPLHDAHVDWANYIYNEMSTKGII